MATPTPTPSNIPQSWTIWISSAAGILAFGIFPLIHQLIPAFPALDVTTVTGALGVFISCAIWMHGAGVQAVINYIEANILPVIVADLGPVLKAELAKIVSTEVQKVNTTQAAPTVIVTK